MGHGFLLYHEAMHGLYFEPTDDEIITFLRSNSLREELISWCLNHRNFLEALKVIFIVNYVGFNGVSISYPKVSPTDEVIGITVLNLKRMILVQDFIVDNSGQHTSFTLYTKLPKGKTHLYKPKVVEANSIFYAKYDRGGKDYIGTHYPEISTLHPELQGRIKNYLEKSNLKLNQPPNKVVR